MSWRWLKRLCPGVDIDVSTKTRQGGGVTQLPLTLRRWKRAKYERLVGLGLFQGDPVELIGGQLVVAEPQGSYHATVVGAVDDALCWR